MKLILSCALALLCAPALLASPVGETASDSIPSRIITLSGNPESPQHREHIAMLYSRTNLAFQDPAAPRFLFFDKQGRVALGIGGYVKALAMYDMNGAIDNDGFTTYDIPAPFDPAQRQRFGASAKHSTLFLKMVARKTRLGRVIVYLQTNFTGDNGGYGLKLEQAYVSVGNLTLGKARSTFSDAPAMAPTVDDQGPCGQVTAKNMLVQYRTPSWRGFSGAISVELPEASYTTTDATRSIAQRFPDIPLYIQYGWNEEASHVRLSGILRELSYRDELAGRNHFVTGWGVQLSAITDVVGGLKFFGHYTYGRGISNYINDFAGQGLDLVNSPDTNGKLVAPRAAGWTAGFQYNFTPKLFASVSYSRSQLFGDIDKSLGGSAYRYGQYAAVNVFYDMWSDLRFGLEYLHGTRKDFNGDHGRANRLEAMLQYSF